MSDLLLPFRSAPVNLPLKVGMIVGSVSIAGGGVIEAVRSLAMTLVKRRGFDVEIFAPEDGKERYDFGTIRVNTAKVIGPPSFGFAPDLVDMMLHREIDVLHVHGLWMYISIAARRWARATGRSYLVSPHGMLDEWALRSGRSKKALARLLFENGHLKEAACIHTLCGAENDAVRRAGIGGRLVTVPNGVSIGEGPAAAARWRGRMEQDARVLLFLGRVTPKKKVAELVRAFDRVWRPGNPWHLVVVGPASPDYLPDVQHAVSDRIRERIHLVGAAYGGERSSAYASADAFVLPSVSEGLPMAALEAFAYGLPALLSPACNLPEAFAANAALPVEPTEDGIARGLGLVFGMEDRERRAMGDNALAFARTRFDWEEIARRMADLYRQVASRDNPVADLARSRTARAGLPA